MMLTKKILIAVAWGILCVSCVEPFGIQSLGFHETVVVEGRLTDEQKRHYVKLSYTRPVDEDAPRPIAGATVWAEDAVGNRIDFIESSSGLYETSPDVAGVAGNSYRLIFTTSNGKQYQSETQRLTASPPIDSIYHRYAERVNTSTNSLSKGIQFFLDTHDDTDLAKFYKYEWEETYQVRASYPSHYEFVDQSPNPDTAVFRDEPVHICYVTGQSSAIILGTTDQLSENRLSEMDVRYITDESDRLREAYSILVKQYVISAPAYSFYRAIVANNENNGSLFDTQLGAVVGNVTSVDEPEETVLGFFEVSGVSSMRIFVKHEDLDPRFPWPNDQYPCSPEQFVTLRDERDSLTYYAKGLGYGVSYAQFCDTTVVPPPPSPGCPFSSLIELAPRYCGDCRFRGPAEKPEFWIY